MCKGGEGMKAGVGGGSSSVIHIKCIKMSPPSTTGTESLTETESCKLFVKANIKKNPGPLFLERFNIFFSFQSIGL